MDNIAAVREFMSSNDIDYLLVNSTNEFLVEYNTLEENSRYKLTNFSGSTGDALVTPDSIYLFVDGRYHIQADMEVNHDIVTVVKLDSGAQFLHELLNRVPDEAALGVFSKKISRKMFESLAKERFIKPFDNDPLDNSDSKLFGDNVKIDLKLCGSSVEDKAKEIAGIITEDEIVYITDLDEVSYFYNLRNFSQDYSAKVRAKALVYKSHPVLFLQEDFPSLYEVLKTSDKEILVDKSTISAYDYNLIKYPKEMKLSVLKLMKSKKNDAEINHLKDAFKRTDAAVSAIREYIENNENLSEFDISQRLREEFKSQGAVALSFSPIVAIDENSALAHYSKASKTKILNDGGLVLIDCGAYFAGGLATDITRVFVKGTPKPIHKKIYTFVLKAFLNAFNHPKTDETTGFDIDSSVHKFFDEQSLDGFVFNHGLGHGIGINVHEAPPNLSQNEIAKVKIEDGMCFTIEPGLYKQGQFGVRLENSCYCENGEIKSFVNMNYEKKLIDFDMLTQQEKQWLSEFEVK